MATTADCEGCARHAARPRDVLRFWATDGDGDDGAWYHVERDGNVYDCTNQTGEPE